jgi:hypothetical protein
MYPSKGEGLVTQAPCEQGASVPRTQRATPERLLPTMETTEAPRPPPLPPPLPPVGAPPLPEKKRVRRGGKQAANRRGRATSNLNPNALRFTTPAEAADGQTAAASMSAPTAAIPQGAYNPYGHAAVSLPVSLSPSRPNRDLVETLTRGRGGWRGFYMCLIARMACVYHGLSRPLGVRCERPSAAILSRLSS